MIINHQFYISIFFYIFTLIQSLSIFCLLTNLTRYEGYFLMRFCWSFVNCLRSSAFLYAFEFVLVVEMRFRCLNLWINIFLESVPESSQFLNFSLQLEPISLNIILDILLHIILKLNENLTLLIPIFLLNSD